MIEASTSGDERDHAAVSAFVERFSSIMVDIGWPRMPARVFVTLLASETSGLTAAQLAERLQVSPAAISGAVRFLLQLDLASRDREPGSRRDVFRVDDDVWARVVEREMRATTKWRDYLSTGIAAVGENTLAAARLSEMIHFFDFLDEQMPDLMRRWHDQRNAYPQPPRPGGR
ncbi:MAG TPA: MarR family transcriptional regulator [Pseudonocardiaceae bacterium]